MTTNFYPMDVKLIHEKIRSYFEVVDEEKHEMRGRIKNFNVIARYNRSGDAEIEEIFLSSPQLNISLVVNSKGVSSVTYVKDGKIEGKNLEGNELEKVIDEILQLLS